ncbi:MAG: acyl carrier protein [Pirellulales bacterium]
MAALMSSDARQLGVDGTKAVVRKLLAARFSVPATAEAIPDDAPLFSVGVGLSSMEGMELLVELEKEFGVRIKDVDWWVYDSPTLANVAEYLIELSGQERST